MNSEFNDEELKFFGFNENSRKLWRVETKIKKLKEKRKKLFIKNDNQFLLQKIGGIDDKLNKIFELLGILEQ